MSHETRTKPPTYPEILDIHDGAFSESIWGSDGFRTIKVSGQSDVVADSYKDNLTIAAGSNITLTTNAAGDTLTIAATGGTYTAGTGLQLSGNQFSVTSLAVTNVHEAANQTAQLALTTQEGDIVVRTDENKSYVKNSGTAGSMSDWTLLRTPTDVVQSVAGNTGAVTANQIAAAVESASDSNTFTDADHAKLNAIEASATADQTDAEIRTAVGAASDSNIFTDALKSKLDAIEASATADQTNEEIQDIVGGMVSGNTETGITVTYEDSDGTLDFVVASQTANDFTNTLKSKLDGIEASADVTDATNVDAAGAVMNSDVDAKGDLLVGSADNTVTRLAVGTNGYILKADSSTGTGLAWGAAGSGGENNQNAFSTVAVSGQDNVAADTTTDTLNLAAGSNVTLTTNASSDTVTIAASNTNAAYMEKAGGTFTGDVKLNNDEELRFGTGTDLIIVHDGTNATIKETTGNLDIRAKNTSGGLVTISDSAGENLIKATAGSSVELTYDGTKKFETTSTGAAVTGTLTSTGNVTTGPVFTVQGTEGISANLYLIADDGDDNGDGWRINSNQDANDLTISNNISGSYVDKLTLTHGGALTVGGLTYPTSDGSNGQVLTTNGSGTLSFTTVSSGGLSNLVEDTSPQLGGDLDTNSFEISLDDSHKVKWGDGNDLAIYHDGTGSFIDNTTGDLAIRVNGTENAIYCEPNSSTLLYYDGSYKAKTVSGGFTVSGTCTATSFSGDGSSLTNISASDATKMPLAGGTFSGSVLFGSSASNQTSIGSNGYVIFGQDSRVKDSQHLAFGDGSDLKIMHNGTDSYLENTTGKIKIQAKSGEESIIVNPDAGVELYYDNSKKFETVSGGVTIHGNMDVSSITSTGGLSMDNPTNAGKDWSWNHSANMIQLQDGVKIAFGNGDDLQIEHDGANSSITEAGTGKLILKSDNQIELVASNNESMIEAIVDGEVKLYHNGVYKAKTVSGGFTVDGTCTATAFAGDGSSLTNITATDSTKLPLAGGTLTGNVRYNDNVKAEFGSSNDMQIYHDGSTGSFMVEGSPTGHLNLGGSQVVIQNADLNETCAKFITDGAVELYHNNVKKLETTSAGATVTGTLVCNSSAVGTAGLRKVHASTSAPGGGDGADGDLWIKY